MRRTVVALKKGWTHSPGLTRRGGKNLAWRPKISEKLLEFLVPLAMEYPRRHPNNWQELEFNRLGLTKWPKEVGFYNAGDNLEMTPEMMHRVFKRNCNEKFWTPKHNETTVISLLPLVEKRPAEILPWVDGVFKHHVARFGPDHTIYNAVMQAYAFAKNFDRCVAMQSEMTALGLAPNIQTYVNMILAAKLAGHSKEKAQVHFLEGIRTGAIDAVMRLDTEYTMWWDQFERLGSFTSKTGLLSVNIEGAKEMPKDMWAIWGWDRTERKFTSQRERIRAEVKDRTHGGKMCVGTVYTKTVRQPWAKYKGVMPWDVKGPGFVQPPISFADAPPADHSSTRCPTAY